MYFKSVTEYDPRKHTEFNQQYLPCHSSLLHSPPAPSSVVHVLTISLKIRFKPDDRKSGSGGRSKVSTPFARGSLWIWLSFFFFPMRKTMKKDGPRVPSARRAKRRRYSLPTCLNWPLSWCLLKRSLLKRKIKKESRRVWFLNSLCLSLLSKSSSNS